MKINVKKLIADYFDTINTKEDIYEKINKACYKWWFAHQKKYDESLSYEGYVKLNNDDHNNVTIQITNGEDDPNCEWTQDVIIPVDELYVEEEKYLSALAAHKIAVGYFENKMKKELDTIMEKIRESANNGKVELMIKFSEPLSNLTIDELKGLGYNVECKSTTDYKTETYTYKIIW